MQEEAAIICRRAAARALARVACASHKRLRKSFAGAYVRKERTQ
jgi:hypothetical protein